MHLDCSARDFLLDFTHVARTACGYLKKKKPSNVVRVHVRYGAEDVLHKEKNLLTTFSYNEWNRPKARG